LETKKNPDSFIDKFALLSVGTPEQSIPAAYSVIQEGIDYINYIATNENVMFGASCLKGTRITVHDIADLRDEGYTINEIITDHYTNITYSQVRMALSYYDKYIKPLQNYAVFLLP